MTKKADAADLLRGARRLEYVDALSLVEAARNPKLHDEVSLEKSLGRFGYTEPILLDERTSRLVAGHGRLHSVIRLREQGKEPPEGVVAREDGAWLVPVIRGWSSRNDTEAEAYLLASNQLTIAGGWDNAQLGRMLLELAEADPTNLAGLGFDDTLLTKLLDGTMPNPGATDPEDIPEPGPIYVKTGDVYRLGEHRITCGDATEAAVVERLLLKGEQPALLFTDPPYGIGYNARGLSQETRKSVASGVPWRNRDRLSIENDDSEADAEPLVRDAIAFAAKASAAYICCDWRSLEMVRRIMLGTGFEPKACIVWDKTRGVQNLDRFHKQHEFILYAGPYGGEKTVAGDVWPCARDFEPDHPTPKPVELVRKAIEAASLRGAIVYEPFSGSGSTLLACEISGRKCRAIELEPKYVQVAIVRWERFTGRKALRLE